MEDRPKPSPDVYSRHILFFPFQWRPLALTNSTGKAALKRTLDAVNASGHWESGVYSHQTDYSAYNYLHDFAHGAIFEQQTNSSVFNFRFLKQLPFSLRVDKGVIPAEITSRFPDDTDKTTALFQLDFFMARLNIYETGVGVLSLFLDNKLHPSPAEVLIINDLARRLYPPHLNFKTGAWGPKREGILPVSIQLGGWEEKWEGFPHDDKKDDIPKRFLPKHILGLLGSNFTVDENKLPQDGILIQQVLDDRMFLISLLIDEKLSKQLGGENAGETPYLESAFWYSYVFADRGTPQIANRAMMRDILQNATYPRWTEDGTLFGISRYSFVAVGMPWLKTPMTNNYFRLTELCLVQRASALRFREEASDIAARMTQDADRQKLAASIRILYGDYIRFINRFHFNEATPVEQGIELYDLLRRQLRIQEQVETLKTELDELHGYATMLHEEDRGRALNFITVLGAAFLLPSCLRTVFSLSDDWKRPLETHPLFTGIVLLAGGILAGILYYTRMLQQKGWRFVLGVMLIVLYLWILCILPHLAEWGWVE